MSPKEINHATIAGFLLRCIGNGWSNAIDASHGLRIHNVAHDGQGGIQIELAEGHIVDITFTHSVPRRVPALVAGKQTHARG